MTYKKLFDVEYNNKKFTIFIDEHDRRTFLELNSKGEYIYPELEDFKALNEIYNNGNPFICYNVEKVTFKEKVRLGSLILAAIVSTNVAIASFRHMEVELKDNNVYISSTEMPLPETESPNQINTIVFKDAKELDAILGYTNVSKEEVEEAIDNNPNLPENYKRISHGLLDAKTSKYPNAELRIFYRHIKTLNVNLFDSYEDLQSHFDQKGLGANYDVANNTINAVKDAGDDIIAHELSHAFDSFYEIINGTLIYRYSNMGHSLKEAANNRNASLLLPMNTYKREELLLNYLESFVDYDFYDYDTRGIDDLIEKLKNKYPDIDINFIINCADSMKDTKINLGIDKSLDESPNLLDELFLLTIKQINLSQNDVYEPFYNFLELFGYVENTDLVFKYLERYNTELINLGYDNVRNIEDIRAKYNLSKKYSGFAFAENFVSPVVVTETHENYSIVEPVDIEGNIIDNLSIAYSTKAVKNMHQLLLPAIIEYPDNYGTEEFWQEFVLSHDLLAEYNFKKVPVYINDNYLTQEYLDNVNVQFGVYDNGKIGYLITNKNGEIIYSDCKSNPTTFRYLSTKVSFPFFFNEHLNGLSKVELSLFLTEENIKKEVKNYPSLYLNASIINDELVFHSPFNVNLNCLDISYYGLPSLVSLTKAGKSISLTINDKTTYFSIEAENEFEFPDTNLEQVLIEMGLLNENNLECSLDIYDIREILHNYIMRNKAR